METRICPYYLHSGVNLLDKFTEKDNIKILNMCANVKKSPSHFIDCQELNFTFKGTT